MKINYPTLAVLSVFVLFAGLIVVRPALAQGKKKRRSSRENCRKWTLPPRLYR